MIEVRSERQMEIIEAAGKILTLQGVGGLTIKNLSKEMDFSESALYRHYTSKEEIIVAMLDYLSNTMDQNIMMAIQAGDDPKEKFRKLFESHLNFFKKHPFYVVAVFSDGLMEESDSINEAILKIMFVNVKHLMPIIMEGQKKGIFTNDIPTEDLMHIVMGAFRLQMFKWRVANFKFDISRSGKNIIQSMLTLIVNK